MHKGTILKSHTNVTVMHLVMYECTNKQMGLEHNHIFRQYLLLSKTCYMFRRFHNAINRHRLKNKGENKHFTLLLKRGIEISFLRVSICLFYIGRNWAKLPTLSYSQSLILKTTVYQSPLLYTFNCHRHQQKILKKLALKFIVTSGLAKNS
jgi:hypothetical protein